MAPQEARVKARTHISEAYSKHAHNLCFTLRLQQKAKPRGIHTPLNEMLIHFSINLLVFYHECRSLIGYATRYLFCDR